MTALVAMLCLGPLVAAYDIAVSFAGDPRPAPRAPIGRYAHALAWHAEIAAARAELAGAA